MSQGASDDDDEDEALEAVLLQRGLSSLFEDQEFSGDLLTRLARMGLSEEEMDAIYKRAEDDILNFIGVVTDAGMGLKAEEALNGFIFRLKRQILHNPSVYVEGS
jgi:hypothetical protein